MKKTASLWPDNHFAICGLSSIDFAITCPSHYRVMFQSRSGDSCFNEEFRAESRPVFKRLPDNIMVCQEKGLLKPGNFREMALAAGSIVHGVAMLRIDGRIPDDGMDTQQLRERQRTGVLTLYSGLRPE